MLYNSVHTNHKWVTMSSLLMQQCIQGMINNNHLRNINQYGNEYEVIFLSVKTQTLYTAWIKRPDIELLNYMINRPQFKVIESSLLKEIPIFQSLKEEG